MREPFDPAEGGIDVMEFTSVVLRSLRRTVEELQVVEGHDTITPEMVLQFNQILEQMRAEEPDNPVWSIVQPMDAQRHTLVDLVMNCCHLEQIAEEAQRRKRGPNRWRVTGTSDGAQADLRSHYEGDVIVEPGCTLDLRGSLHGDVILLGNATLDCRGYLQGNVYAEAYASIQIRGKVDGSILPLRERPTEE